MGTYATAAKSWTTRLVRDTDLIRGVAMIPATTTPIASNGSGRSPQNAASAASAIA